jgi:hypothetical protein
MGDSSQANGEWRMANGKTARQGSIRYSPLLRWPYVVNASNLLQQRHAGGKLPDVTT